MHSLTRRIIPSLLVLLSGIPASAIATDLTLPYRSWSQLSAKAAAPFDPNDPIGEWLMMEEIDVWGRIRKGFAMPDLDHPLVATHTQWFAARPEYFDRTTPRAARYLYHVVQELEKRGMPTELALLPFIESAFNPHAYSSAKAAGLWQFIPSTGREYNLTQSVFMDERRSVIASTEAALTYLQKLHGMFGDWHLALAAYNWGEGSVQRAMKRSRAAGGATDFNGLARFMPAETRNYVPKLQALKNVIAAPDQYAIALPRVDNQPYFVTIGKTRDIDLSLAAQLAEMPLEEFKALNPQFNKPVIPGGSGTQILLPRSNAEKFKENIANWSRALSSWSAHTVTSTRERLETIAKKFGTTPEVLREVNNIPPRTALAAGSTILVPKSEAAADKNIAPELLETARLVVVPDVETRRTTVKVSRNDTLSAICATLTR
ncbi:MAG TPA: transglycosylase SLT domain-containing protein, partial [Noviherbaspirillum sp.]|nr:transglycosylase SLT domain-containing protein [Noviherbaspirillum sp.]